MDRSRRWSIRGKERDAKGAAQISPCGAGENEGGPAKGMGKRTHGLELRLPKRFHGARTLQARLEGADQLEGCQVVDLPQRGDDGRGARVEERPLEPH